MMTLKEISEKYGVSRSGIYKKLSKISDFNSFKKKHMKMIHGKWEIDNIGSKFLGERHNFVRPKSYETHILTKSEIQKRLDQEINVNQNLIRVVEDQEVIIDKVLHDNSKRLKTLTDKKNNLELPSLMTIKNTRKKFIKKITYLKNELKELNNRNLFKRIFNLK